MLIHATTVAIGGKGVVIRGAPGSGKSDLALRLLEAGARLVADDQTEIAVKGGRVVARAPRSIKGMIEVRGVGIVKAKAAPQIAVALVVDLVAPGAVERLPAPESAEILGIALPLLRLAPFEASAPAKLRAKLRLMVRGTKGL